MFTVQTQEVIDRLKPLVDGMQEEQTQDLEKSAKDFLKWIWYKWRQFLKWEKLLDVARKSWFEW